MQFNKRRFGTLLLAIFIVSMLSTFSTLINNANALQNDNDLSVTIHGHMNSNSAEVSSNLMPIGTYSYYQTPELSVGTFNHDVSMFDLTNIQFFNQSVAGVKDFSIINNVNDTTGNHSLSFVSIPYYELDTPFDTVITLNENYTINTPINYTNNPYNKGMVFQESFDSNYWSLIGCNTIMTISSYCSQDSYVDEASPTTNYATDNFLSSWNGQWAFFGSPNRLVNYLTDNKTGNSIYKMYVLGYVLTYPSQFYSTNSFNENTLTWNNKPSSIEYITSISGGSTGWRNVSLSSTYYEYYYVRPTGNSWFAWDSDEATHRPVLYDFYSKIYQGSGSVYAQTNLNEDSLTIQSPVYTNTTNLLTGDYLSIDIKPKCNDQINVSLILNGIVQKTMEIVADGNTDQNQRIINITVDSNVSFNQIKVFGTLEDTEYFRLYDIKAYNYGESDFVKNIYIKNFNYQILGVDYYENYTLIKDSGDYSNEIGNCSYHFDSTMFTQYDYIYDVIIPNQNLTIEIELLFMLDANVSFHLNISYSTGQWILPSDVNLKLNGENIDDNTYNSGYVFLNTFPNILVFTSDTLVYFKFNSTTKFSFSFRLDIISRTHLETQFELLSNHLIYFDRIDFSNNLNIKVIYLNDNDKGNSNPNILSPSVSMNVGNKYKLVVILAEEIYIPLQYYRNSLGSGTSNLYVSATSNSFKYTDLTRFDVVNVAMPSQWETEQALLQFSNIYYTPYYVSNSSYNINSEYAESMSVSDVDVDWDPEYHLTPSNGTRIGEYDADAGMVATMSPVPDNFTILNGSAVYYDDMNVMDGVYTDFRSTQENASAVPIYYQFLNGSLISSGSLWSTNGAYSNFKSTTGSSGIGSTDTGYLTGTSVSDPSSGWTNDDYARASDNNDAESSTADNPGRIIVSFAPNIPINSVINGIIVTIEHQAQSGNLLDREVKLQRDGVVEGDDKKKSGDTWWDTESEQTWTYGASNDLWGLTWTVAQINSVGVSLNVQNFYGTHAHVDAIKLKVYYTGPPGALATLNFTSTLQISKSIDSQISTVQLNYNQRINTTITAGIRSFYIWNFGRNAYDVVNSTISTANYHEMIFSMNSSHYNSSYNIKLKWIITRTDVVTPFSLYIDKMVVRMNLTSVINITSTFQFANQFLDYVNGMELNYAQRTNSSVNMKGFYIWNFDLNQWYCVNNTISSSTFYDICFTLNSSFYNATNYIKLQWILSKSNANSRYSLYIDELLLTVWFTVNDDEYDTVVALWITDTIIYAHQMFQIYFQSYDNLPDIVEISEKVNVGSPSLIFTIPIINNTLQLLNCINETAGQYFLNFTFFDDFNNWEMWTLNLTLHSSVSINLAYPNPTFVNKYSNVSVYIKATTDITSIHYDNSTDWLLRAESYPITETNFTFTLIHASAQVFNVSVLVINAFADKWWVNVTSLTCVKNAIYIDILNMHSRYYQTDLFNVTVFMRDITNSYVNQVVQYSLDYQDNTNIMNGGVMANAYTPIQLDLNYVYDCGYYHFNCSYISSVYLNYWKLMSFDLYSTTRLNSSTDVSLTVNGYSVVNNTILMNYSSIFTFTSLDNTIFDLDIVMYLNHTESKAYDSYLSLDFDFQTTIKITDLTITNATISSYPTNFTYLYINGLLSSTYTKIGTVLIIDDIISDVMLDDNSYTIYLTYIDNSPTRTQLTTSPTSEDTSVLFEEYLHANRSFSYWYFVNSLEINDVELEHIRTGTTISTFTVNGSMYYFTESSLCGDQFTATINYKPKWNISYTMQSNTGIYTKIQVRYKSALIITNVSVVLDLSSSFCYNELWTLNATQNENDLKLTIPSVDFTTSYQTLTIEGYSSVPYANISSYATVYPGTRIIMGETVEFAGYLDYPKFTNVFTLAVSSRWTCYDVHYGNNNQSIGLEQLSDSLIYIKGYGFNPSVNNSFVHFSTRPFTKVDWQYDDTTDIITITINSLLPVSDVYFLYAWDPAQQHSLLVQQSPSELIDLSDSGDYDGYLFFGMDELEAGETVIKIYVNYVTPMELIVQFVIIAAILGISLGLFYYFKYNDNARKQLEKFLNKQVVERLESIKGENKGLESMIIRVKDGKLYIDKGEKK